MTSTTLPTHGLAAFLDAVEHEGYLLFEFDFRLDVFFLLHPIPSPWYLIWFITVAGRCPATAWGSQPGTASTIGAPGSRGPGRRSLHSARPPNVRHAGNLSSPKTSPRTPTGRQGFAIHFWPTLAIPAKYLGTARKLSPWHRLCQAKQRQPFL